MATQVAETNSAAAAIAAAAAMGMHGMRNGGINLPVADVNNVNKKKKIRTIIYAKETPL